MYIVIIYNIYESSFVVNVRIIKQILFTSFSNNDRRSSVAMRQDC